MTSVALRLVRRALVVDVVAGVGELAGGQARHVRVRLRGAVEARALAGALVGPDRACEIEIVARAGLGILFFVPSTHG